MESISYLNGLEETPLPLITAGTANEYIRVNSNETSYELAQPSDILPSQTGNSGKVLSTDGTTTSWSNDLNLSKVKLSEGSRTAPSLVWNDPQDNTGFYGDGDNSIIYSANGNNQVKFTTGGIQLYGSAGATIRGLSSNDTILSNGSFGFSGQAPVIQQITPSPQSSARIIVNTNNIEFANSGSSVTPSLRMSIGTTQVSTNVPLNITHNGSATNPSLLFGDSTVGGRSGMYSAPTDNTLNFCTNEVERMSIDNTGVKVVTVRADSGSQVDDKGYVFEDSHGSGLQWETTGSILRLCHANSTMIGISSNTVSINATTITANGNLTSSSKINVPNGSTGGIGLLNRTTQVDFNTTGDTVNLRSFGTVRVQASNSGVSLTGNTTVGSGTFTVSGGLADFGQAARVTGNLTVQSGNLILGTNNIASANTVNSNIFKTSAQGSNTLCAVRVNEDNCGMYQSTSGNLDIAAGGANGLNINSSRVQTANIFNFNRCPAYQSNTQSGSGSFSITTTSNPCLFIFIPISGNSDLDFSASSNYFAGQQFQIITRDVSGRTGTIRYRAQSETINITGGAAATTITSNTYHTLTLDRYHIVICNVDSNRFYLIQT